MTFLLASPLLYVWLTRRGPIDRKRCYPELEEIEPMIRAAAVLTFVAMLLIAGVTEVPAVAFNSGAGIGSCSGGATTLPAPTTCAGGFVAIAPNGAWQPNNPGGSS